MADQNLNLGNGTEETEEVPAVGIEVAGEKKSAGALARLARNVGVAAMIAAAPNAKAEDQSVDDMFAMFDAQAAEAVETTAVELEAEKARGAKLNAEAAKLNEDIAKLDESIDAGKVEGAELDEELRKEREREQKLLEEQRQIALNLKNAVTKN